MTSFLLDNVKDAADSFMEVTYLHDDCLDTQRTLQITALDVLEALLSAGVSMQDLADSNNDPSKVVSLLKEVKKNLGKLVDEKWFFPADPVLMPVITHATKVFEKLGEE